MQNSQLTDDHEDRAATRARLMSAARTVAERDGVENVTLSKVASEAGVPRPTIYGQFARKEDLLMSIVSEDLTTLARSLDGVEWPQGGDTPESAVPMPEAETPVVEVAEAPVETLEVAKDTAPVAAVTPRQRLPRRGDLAQLLEAKPEDAEPAPRAPDAWLERRLRVFERAMTAMETRQAEVEKTSRSAVATAEERAKALEAKIEELIARADAADAKAKAQANDVRGALNETSLRLQTVESVARAALAENKPVETPDPEAVAAVEPTLEPQVEPVSAVATDDASADTGPKSFIAGVRANVVAATAAAAAQAEAKVEVKAQKSRRSLTRYFLGGLVVLVVFIAAAGIAFSKGVSDGRREALQHVTRIAPPAMAMHQTSLDQLTARARGGDAAAELAVGLRYLTQKSPAEAQHWVSLAAIKGQPVAQYVLGTFYAQGTGAPADASRALQWYEAAALQGNRKAMHALAIAYAEGLGTAKSASESVRWFSRAASFGYVDSQFNLAVLYERGAGVPLSLLDAYKWYAVAGRAGDGEAKQRIEALRTQLGADDLAAAERAAAAFHPLPYDVAANTAP